jgi:cyclohexanecarboxyl-CoA dehydrogenase
MISFAFTTEQEAFRAELLRFAAAELAPRYLERAAVAEFPWDAHRQLADLGVLGLGLPERFGGSGDPDPITLGLATEALAGGDPNVAAAPVQVGLVAAQLAALASAAVAERYVPRLISGEIVAAIAVTEPSAGSDAASLTTSVRPVPGGWLLSGEKIAITNATAAAVALVYARQHGTGGHAGISCFAVDLDWTGVSRAPMPGLGALPLCWGSLAFEDVFVPAECLVGEEGQAFSGVMHHFDWLRAVGRPHTDVAAMCKWWAPQIAKDAIETAWVTHGNIGYSAQSPQQQRYRDVASYLVADGTAAIQKRIIATSLLGRVAAQ